MAKATLYSAEVLDALCGHIAEGMSVSAACAIGGTPSKSTVFRWLADSSKVEFRAAYARACEARSQRMMNEILEIADMRGDDDHVERCRLQIQARQWTFAKMTPRKYG